MRRFVLDAEQLLPRPLEEVFAFFSNPGNLQRITPPWLDFEIIGGHDRQMRAGLLIDYRLRIHGLPVRWQSEITSWDPPRRFVDEQRRGPYRLWIHEHTFEARGNDTLIRDHLQYAVPGGALVQKLFVARDVDRIFAFRRQRLEEIFAAGDLAWRDAARFPAASLPQHRAGVSGGQETNTASRGTPRKSRRKPRRPVP